MANGVVYVGSENGNIYALNATTGALLWTFFADVSSSPTVVNGAVYVGSYDANIYTFELLPDTYFMIKSSANPDLLNEPVTFTTTSVARDKSLGYVTGTVTFKDGAKTLGTVPISGSHAAITTSALGIGTHNIMAYYSGNNVFAANAANLYEVVTEVALSAKSLNFGNQTVGTTSALQSVTIASVGSTPLNIAKLFVTGNFKIQASTCSTTLAAGAPCTVTIVFQPAGTSNRYGHLWIYDNGGGSPQKVELTGVGI